MSKSKARISTSLELVGTPFNFCDVIYREIPKVEGALPFLRIEKVGNLVRILKTEGFLGDFDGGHQFDFKIHRTDDQGTPNEIHTGTGEVHKVTIYTRIKGEGWYYALDGMDDGNLRVIHSEAFLEGWEHTDILGFNFTRVIIE